MYAIPISEKLLAELTEKHNVNEAVFLIDYAYDLEGALRRNGLSITQNPRPQNQIERIFREVDR